MINSEKVRVVALRTTLCALFRGDAGSKYYFTSGVASMLVRLLVNYWKRFGISCCVLVVIIALVYMQSQIGS